MDTMQPYLAVGLEFLSQLHSLDQACDTAYRQGVALRTLNKADTLTDFLNWDKWEEVIPSLPGEAD